MLVWLLKKVLYGRIIRAIDEREGKITARLAEAAAMEKEAGAQLALYQAKLQEFEQTHEDMLAHAKLDADKQQAEMLEKAREYIRSLETKWQEDLNSSR